MSIERRVARLEEAAGRGPGGGCDECGGPEEFGPDDTYEVVWADPGSRDARPEFCEACGRQTTVIITCP
jgi:hypothetical protein